MFDYKGKVALVTGASSGIGKAYAEELASKGCHVILTARSKEKLDILAEKLVSTYKIQAFPIMSDLSQSYSVEQLVSQIKDLGLNVDILINNAGFSTFGPFEKISYQREYEEITVNITSLVTLTHHLLPYMQQQKEGIIVNVASIAAFQPTPYGAVYSASKAFVLSFSEALWAENRMLGVKVLALCPGPTQTDFFNVAGIEHLPGGAKTPQEVVKAAFRGIEKDKCYITIGFRNYLMYNVGRLLTRRFVAKATERYLRSTTPAIAEARSSSENN